MFGFVTTIIASLLFAEYDELLKLLTIPSIFAIDKRLLELRLPFVLEIDDIYCTRASALRVELAEELYSIVSELFYMKIYNYTKNM